MFEQVKQEIDDKIKTNGNNEITANRLNSVLQDMMDASAEVIGEVQQSIGDQVEANPTGEATETLGKIKIGETIYTAPKGPQGEPGADGQDGQPGAPGPANTLSIGTVTDGEQAAASITGEAPNQTLNLTLPAGKSAYQLYRDGGGSLSQEAWLASLKANIGAFQFITPTDTTAEAALTTIGDTYASAIGGVSPSPSTLSVILLMNDSNNTKTMMIATQEVTPATTPATYEFVYAGDLQSAMPSNVLTQTNIVNDLTTGGQQDVLSAEQGKVLNKRTSQVSFVEEEGESQSIVIKSDDETETILYISENEVNAKNLKSNGKNVLTEDDRNDFASASDLEELENEIQGKQDIIPDIINEETTRDGDGKEIIFSSDDYNDSNPNDNELFAKIGSYGVMAKSFRLLDGTQIGAANDILYNKKWAVFGDSFTAYTNGVLSEGKYAGNNATYPYLIGNRTNINVISFFASGRTLAFPATPGTFVNSVTNPNVSYYYQNIPQDIDYITIYLGINDSHHAPGSSGGDGEDNTGEIPIGTINDNTTSTYYGAWNVVLSWLIENRPFAHIGIIVSNGCGSDYRTAQIAIARKYGIPFIDLNGDDRTPFMIRSSNTDIPSNIRNLRTEKQAVDYDGTQTGSVNLHPNTDAHLYESYFIENFLRTI